MKPLPKTSCRFLALPLLLLALAGLTHFDAGAQSMGISSSAITPDASSILEMRTTSKGLLIPRMTTAERDAITSPATGLMIFNTTSNKFNFYNGSSWTVFFSGTSGLNSITGISNRIAIGGTSADPTVDISSSYAGQNSITTLGTITTGTWNGTIITSAYGGTGNGFTKFSGPTTSEKTFALPDASATILTTNAAVTVAQGGTGVGTITGVIKGNGTSAFTAATSGTDYSAGTSALATGILKSTTSTGALSIAVPADFPTLNQNTTGSAATLTTSRNIYGNAFNGSADLSQIIASTFGGTGNGFTKFNGPVTTEKTFTLPNASATILTSNAAVTVAQGGTGVATITGMIKGNGTSAFTAATAGTDYSVGTSSLATGILKSTTSTGALSIAVPADFPTLNQNTTGSAATLTTSRNIYGNAFNGSTDLAQVIASTFGGTGNGFTKFSGPATAEKTFTLPNASATILTDNAAVTEAQGGTGNTSYTTGDLLYASGATTLSKLAGVATGNALISGGTSTAPSWGKIGLTTHVNGILPIANGGTNSTATPTNGGIVYGDGTSYEVTAAGTSGQVLKSNGAGVPTWEDGVNIVTLASDVVNNNNPANIMANVTGLSFSVTAGVTYRFRALIIYTAAATSTGSRWSISGPATPTLLAYTSQYSLTATSVTSNNATAYDIPAASNATSATTTGNIAMVDGVIRPSANGTVTVRFASEIANSAITAKAGSTLTWW